MAIELGPVVLDVETPIKNAAAKVPQASKPLEAAVEKEIKRISNAIAKLQKESTKGMGAGGIDEINKKMTTYAHTVELAAKSMVKYGQQQGKLTAGRLDIKALSSEITVLANKWNALKLGSKFDADGKLRVRAQELIDRMSRLTAQTVKFGNALSASSVKASAATKSAAAGIEATNMALTKQSGILSRLTGYLSGYTLLFAGLRFVRNIRETTAEFEMQRVALGSIINDAEQANLLFRQIKAAAIESPFQIKDLVTYTKQLSAYRVETENLFNITMRLADVSAGLGVDMNRLVLAYGQVRAAAVLRGQELRQFTEAGIPLVDLLAKKFTELNGKMVSTADVFELITKRAVPFEMVAEVFDDMTNAGGVFYKMQEKQAETLAGQWSNLKDALSIMYDEIGNTDSVHNAMSSLIQDAKFLFQNWRTIAQLLKTVAINYGIVKVSSLFIPKLARDTKLVAASEAALARAQQLEAAQQVKNNALREISINQLKRYSREMAKAAVAQTTLERGWHKFAASMLGGGWIGLAVTAVSVLTGLLISAWKESRRLNQELEKIGKDGGASINKSIYNFKRLADTAVMAAYGSNEQNEALAELQRTYGDIIPVENLQIDKLEALEGNYRSLTDAIRQKISMQTKEQEINAVSDYFASKVQKERKKTINLLSQYGLDKQQINAVLDEVQNMVDEGLIGIETSIGQRSVAVENVIKKLTGIAVDLGNGFRDYEGVWHTVRENNDNTRKSIENIVETYIQLQEETRKIENDMSGLIGSMGVYADSWNKLKKEIDKVTVSEEEFGNKQTFAYKKEKIRKEVELMAKAIEEAFKDTGIDISEAIQPGGKIDFESINTAASKSELWGIQDYMKKIQEAYEGIVPSDQMVDIVERKFKSLAEAAGLSMDDIQGYLFRGNKDLRQYVKDLQEDLEDAQDEVNKYNLIKDNSPLLVDQKNLEKWEALADIIKQVIESLSDFKKKTKEPKDSYVQDPLINQIKEQMKYMKDFQKGYDDFRKYMSDTSALEKESGIMKFRGQALGLSIDDQNKAAKNLSEWYSTTMADIFKRVQEKYHITGDLEYFLSQEIKDTTNRGKALKDFQELLQSLFDAKTDFDTSQEKENIEKALNKLKDEIKRSEAARNFFRDILDLTGDEDLATNITISAYGDIGADFKDKLQEQLNEAFKTFDTQDADLLKKMGLAIKDKDWDFILSHLDKFGEEWQSVLKDMENSDLQYNATLMKNFATLISKYGNEVQRVVTIRARADKEIQDVKDALALSLQNKKLTTEEKAALQSRADEIIKILEGQRDLDIFKESDDYIKFFSEINTMTIEQAVKVRGELRRAYIDAFHKGSISADELRKNLRSVDEQFKKLNEDTSVFSAYLNGGFDGAFKKIQAYANEIDVLAAKIKGGKTLDEGEQNFVVRMLQSFGSEEYKNIESFGDFLSKFEDTGGVEKAGEAFGKMGEGMSTMASEGPSALFIVDQIIKSVNATITGLQQIIDQINEVRSEDKKIGGWFRYLSDFNKYAYSGWEKLKSGDVIGAATDTVSSLISIYNNIKKSLNQVNDEEIERQADLLEDLEYQYSRLNVAIRDAFGSDYIYNYNKQLEVLRAQAEAYRRQADEERKKGKSSDEKKAKGYEKNAREIEDQISDRQSQLSEFFSGSDLTSAAKGFAQSWIDAYKEFGNTTDAMKEKFQDMIQEMITNSLAARIMQEQLAPIFKMIDDLSQDDGLLSATDISTIAAAANETIPMINNSLTTLMSELTAAGYNMRQQVGHFTGISRNIAGASEESINGLAAGINTQNFYMQHIDATVTAILAAMTGGSTVTNEGAAGAVTNPYQEEMLSIPRTYLPQMSSDLSNIYAILRQITSDNRTKSVWVRM